MNISFIGCRNTTKEIISRLLDSKIKIENLITLIKKIFINIIFQDTRIYQSFVKQIELKFIMLKNIISNQKKIIIYLRKLNIDILFVLGQRIIPESILNLLK